MRKLTLCLSLLAAGLGAATIEHIAGGGLQTIGAAATEIRMDHPFGVVFDAQGNWYVCEYKGHRVVKVDRRGRTSLVAGTGEPGYGGDGGPGAQATLNEPHGLVIAKDGNLYIADTRNHSVRRVDLKTGVITTFAGTGQPGFSGDGGPASEARFNGVFAIAANPQGDQLYLTDLANRRIRRVELQSRVVTTVAGNGEKGVPADGARATESPLADPRAAAADSKGNLYVLERGGNALRLVDREGRIRTLLGAGAGNPALSGPKHLAIDKAGNVIIADDQNHLIRVYTPSDGKLVTVAGTGEAGDRLVKDDPLQSQLNRPHGVTVHPSGDIYISDSWNHRVLRLSTRTARR